MSRRHSCLDAEVAEVSGSSTGVTGTLSLGPSCGHVGSPMSIYPIGGSVICDAGNYDAQGITTGPDGALWFTNYGQASVGRMTTSGKTTIYPAGAFGPTSITTGPDGALWFTNVAAVICCGDTLVATGGSIGRITTSGTVTSVPDRGGRPRRHHRRTRTARCGSPTAPTTIGRITTSGAVTIYSGSGISYPTAITAGPDGALWFTGDNSAGLNHDLRSGKHLQRLAVRAALPPVRMVRCGSPAPTGQCVPVEQEANGVQLDRCHRPDDDVGSAHLPLQRNARSRSRVPSPSPPGPDGALWFTNYGLDPSIGRITTSGSDLARTTQASRRHKTSRPAPTVLCGLSTQEPRRSVGSATT